ncbi:MAG TPA: ATP-binding protein [Candidatus Nanoarchaeia archaeon]|nr:ATP-binding protein [Candidatus Nanoarchaeia archaeon]
MLGGIIVAVFFFIAVGSGLGIFAFVAYRRVLRRAKAVERGLKMVPMLIHLPQAESALAGGRDPREVMRETVSQAGTLYDLLVGTTQNGFKSNFYGQRHISLELVAAGGVIHYYAAVPVALVSVAKQAILTAYPGAQLEETQDYNIFNAQGKIAGTSGGELVLKQESAYPIATIDSIEHDPMEAILNVLSGLGAEEGAAVQILLRPANQSWVKRSIEVVKSKRQKGDSSLAFTATDMAKAAVKAPEPIKSGEVKQLSGLEQTAVEQIEGKTQHAAYEVLVRVVASTETPTRAQTVVRDLVSAFALFDAPGLNGFKYLPAGDMEGLVTAFIFRFFPPELDKTILNSQELATVFHLPSAAATPTSQVERQASKEVDSPPNMPTTGLLLGYNEFRGVRKEAKLTPEDRRRHTYIVGQTGTGKSTMLENLAVQDMLAGNGFAFIDPHGDTAERLLGMVPKSRTEDVIYFNPADTDYPLGLNLFEFSDPAQKDFLIQETIGMLYKLYDPGHTGIIGPRYEHWFRNAALTLMSDPAGATFLEVPKVFTDSAYLKNKFQYVKDPTVADFWSKEMAQTSDYHKSEMLGWFVSKFGAFQSNEMMRNIIGQPKSAFNLRDVMDNKKILIVNLSKGRIGELNSQLLGMIFVIKFQAAAMSRAEVAEEQRPDFCLYVDEFQNFSTDSFASILSEARKYHLNLIVANQFIGQLSDQIRDAVFGNVGTIVSYRSGPEDADFLVKQFAPAFDARDIVGLPNYHAITRLMIGGLPSSSFSLTALSPLGMANPELGLAVKQLSAAKFGRNKSQVEAEIFGRLSSSPSTQAGTPATPTNPASQAAPAPAVSVATATSTPPPAHNVDLSTVINSDVGEPAKANDSLVIKDIVKDQPTSPAAIQTFHQAEEPTTPTPTMPAPPAPAAPTPRPAVPVPAQAVPTPTTSVPAVPVLPPSPPPAPVSAEPAPKPDSTEKPFESKTEAPKSEGEKVEDDIAKEIAAAGLSSTVKIVDPKKTAPVATLQGFIPIDPKPQAQPVATPTPATKPEPATAPVPPPAAAPVPAPIPPVVATPVVTSPIPAPQPPAPLPSWSADLSQAGTKPQLSGNKPQPDPGEVMVDEHGNVHVAV